MTFAQQLHAHRKRLRLNQAEIAAVLSVSFRTYHDWEHGREPHPLTMEGALARLEAMQLGTHLPPSAFAQCFPSCSIARKHEVEDWMHMIVNVMAQNGNKWRMVTNDELAAAFPHKAHFFANLEGCPGDACYLDHARHILREHPAAEISPVWANLQDRIAQAAQRQQLGATQTPPLPEKSASV